MSAIGSNHGVESSGLRSLNVEMFLLRRLLAWTGLAWPGLNWTGLRASFISFNGNVHSRGRKDAHLLQATPI